jgi:capsular exopolysaccharide synthesis family protein
MNSSKSLLKTKDVNALQDAIRQYGKYWKWYVISCVAMLALGVVYLKIKAPVFSITSNVLIKTEDSQSGAMGGASLMKNLGGLGGMMSSESIDDELIVMSSQTLMRQMVYNLKLFTTYELAKFPFDKSLYNTSPVIVDVDKDIVDTLSTTLNFKIKVEESNALEVTVKDHKGKIGSYRLPSLPAEVKTKYGTFRLHFANGVNIPKPYKINSKVFGLDIATEKYKEITDISSVSRKASVIGLTIEDVDKVRGKDILDEIVRLYNIDALSDKNRTALTTVEFLKARTDSIYDDLRGIEGRIEQYKTNNKLIDTQMEAGTTVGQLTELQKKSVEYDIQESLIKSIDNIIKDKKNRNQLLPQSLVLSGDVNAAIEQYNTVILQRMRLLRNSNEQNPVVIALDDQINELNKQVLSTLDHARKDILLARNDWGAREKMLMGRTSQIPRLEREYVDIKRQQEVKSEIYLFLLQKLEETQLTLASNTPKAKVIDNAYVLSKPVAPKKMITLLTCLALGFIIPLLIVYIKEELKTSIDSKEELEKLSDSEVIGEIARANPEKKIIVTPKGADAPTELFRLLRTNLMFTLDDPSKKVVLVSSTVPGEGKTYVSSNLAVSLALTDKKVILLGLDIRNPRLSEYVKTKSAKGVTNYLSDTALTTADIICHSDIDPNLDIIMSGPIPPNPNELLMKNRLEELFQELRKEYDYIIMDTAPIGMVSDTFHLNRVADVCLYVVKIGTSTRSSIKFLNTTVANGKLKNLYVVANHIDLKKKNDGYGYGYGSK